MLYILLVSVISYHVMTFRTYYYDYTKGTVKLSRLRTLTFPIHPVPGAPGMRIPFYANTMYASDDVPHSRNLLLVSE